MSAIKEDAKDFKRNMMREEREKMLVLKPIYQIIKRLIPYLNLSQQNMHYYASLIHYYSIHELRERLKTEQTYLYLLCYAWKRYQQINDNLVHAFCFHFKQVENKIKIHSSVKFSEHAIRQHEEFLNMRRLAQLYIRPSAKEKSEEKIRNYKKKSKPRYAFKA